MNAASYRIPFKLYLIFNLVGILTSNDERSTFQDRYSVTSFEGLGHYYSKLRLQSLPTWAKVLGASKGKICRQIFYKKYHSREYFVGAAEIRMNHKYRNKIAKLSPYDRHTTRSRLRTIFVNNNDRTNEMTFSCWIYDFIRNTIEPYYVSKYTYNVNDLSGGEYIGGRFIFARRGRLEVHSLAEEYARKVFNGPRELEKFYLDRRSKYLPEVDAKNDPVCKLDKGRKSRICNAVTMDERLRGTFGVTFDECEKKDFFINKSLLFDEWMMICQTVGHINETFYVSRSYAHNEVFVFKITDHKLQLKFLAVKIGVVIDEPVLNICISEKEDTSSWGYPRISLSFIEPVSSRCSIQR